MLYVLIGNHPIITTPKEMGYSRFPNSRTLTVSQELLNPCSLCFLLEFSISELAEMSIFVAVQFSINIGLCKHFNRWFCKSTKYKMKKNLTLHYVSRLILMLSEEEKLLMNQCTQVSINGTNSARFASHRNQFGSKTMWSRNQVYHIQNRNIPISKLSSNASSDSRLIEYCELDPDINLLYMTYDLSNHLMMLTGKKF